MITRSKKKLRAPIEEVTEQNEEKREVKKSKVKKQESNLQPEVKNDKAEKKSKEEHKIEEIKQIAEIKNEGKDDEYTDWRVLGKGAFATTYAANNKVTNKTVAIKLMMKNQARVNPKAITKMWHTEVDIMRKIEKHCQPFFVCFIKAIETEDAYCIVMQYLGEYIDMEHFIRNHLANASMETLTSIVKNMMQGLQGLHALDIMHRDIKPANIMVCIKGEHIGAIKYIDFGLGCDDDNCTARGPVGTRYFWSPELEFAQEIWERSVAYRAGTKHPPLHLKDFAAADLFALGMTIFALLSHYKNYFVSYYEKYKAKVLSSVPIAEIAAYREVKAVNDINKMANFQEKWSKRYIAVMRNADMDSDIFDDLVTRYFNKTNKNQDKIVWFGDVWYNLVRKNAVARTFDG